jgi:tetratricopeptide (TPR) repeat protein
MVRAYFINYYIYQPNHAVTDRAEGERLLALLDGLPLAIAQAAAFLQESGIALQTYIRFYEHQWKELMNPQDREGAPLQDYPDRSVWTTWSISYNAIREKHVPTANLILLWALLDNKNMWYGLFAAACSASTTVTTILSEWIGDLAISEVEFAKAMQLLRNYSLIEDVEGLGSYATHPVVHRWACYFQGKDSRAQLAQLATMVVGWAVPQRQLLEDFILQSQLLPHAQACSRWLLLDETRQRSERYEKVSTEINIAKERVVLLDAILRLGNLYAEQGKLTEAEAMYQRALKGREVYVTEHPSTLDTVNNLGLLYRNQGKLTEAEAMYQRVLKGREVHGIEHPSTLDTVNNLGLLYRNQGKLTEAEAMYRRALQGKEDVLGIEHPSTLDTVNNLGILYHKQGKLTEAEAMYQRVLKGREVYVTEHLSTLDTVNNLGILYAEQGKLAEARIMLLKALVGYEKSIGFDHPSSRNLRDMIQSLDTVTDKKATDDEEESVNDSQGETLHLGAVDLSPKSKRYRLLKTSGLK